jgi:hypothetical protein
MVEPGKASLDSLAPARRAVLVLLASQSRSYSDIATLLATDESDIRARAFDAAEELLAEQPSPPEPPVRQQLVDYALGQQRVSERQQTRAMLADDAGARAWLAALESALGLGDPSATARASHPSPPPEESTSGEPPEDPLPADREPPEDPLPADREPPADPLPADREPPAPAGPSMAGPPAHAAPAVATRLNGPRVYMILGTMAIVAGIVLLFVSGGHG